VLLDCNAAVARMMGEFVAGAQADMAVLKEAANALAASGGAPADIAAVQRVTHNLKGLGGGIGLPLLTTVGESLCDLLRDRQTVDDRVLDLIDQHVAAMDCIVTRPIMADGGLEGASLLGELRAASETINAYWIGAETTRR